ncbi:MAG: 4-hydroxythreonine-4-phosphate dehydrogenase PdxA [Alphaproteobacteria bacterium]|nr:4-hydroxythreonine-4-phosphate dehydrogenase PdxA [Alphaproteobacteria bacterium]
MAMTRKSLVVSMGEPAGVAPELTALAWQTLHHLPEFCFALIGDGAAYESRAQAAGIDAPFIPIAQLDDAQHAFESGVPYLNLPLAVPSLAGKLDARNSLAVIRAVDRAVAHCLSGEASAMITNPIQKETLYDVGFKHQGHTDYIAALARQAGHDITEVMMLVGEGLRSVPVTVHIPLADVPRALTTEAIIAQGHVVAESLRRSFGVAHPRIAVTGLNPHAGENGALGKEDQLIVAPAIAGLKAMGINAFGPLPADTAFHPEARATYDAILCMYHDQALIPVKTLDFHGGVNVTLGLPFIRTSPDHGTALGIAGKGVANPTSLIAAIKLASSMVVRA